MTTTPLHPDAIRRLVAEVIARIQSEQAARAVTAAPAGARPAATPAGQLVLTDKVVTLAMLEKLPAGTRHVLLPSNAVVTPSAREFARDHAIDIARGSSAGTASTAPRPFLVARAECPDDIAGRAATIVLAVPGAQQLPPTGLADVVTTLATHASRDAARGVLLATRPAVAALLANRQAALRAVTGRDVAALLAAAGECAANLLVVDPRQLSAGSLERLCVDFARRDLGPAPLELGSPPQPCACTGHSH